jgi:hypothetical protein
MSESGSAYFGMYKVQRVRKFHYCQMAFSISIPAFLYILPTVASIESGPKVELLNFRFVKN